MKTEIGSSNKRLIMTTILIFISLIGSYIFEYSKIYNSIKVSVSDTATIEYGSANYDINSLVDNVNGEIISIKKDVDTSKVGIQEVIVEVKKEDVIREVPIQVEVKDTIAPEIKIKEENISLTAGDNFDMFSNLEYVSDVVSGNIDYQQKEIINEEVDTNYYTIDGNVDTKVAGVYPVTIKAVDKYGNTSLVTYKVEVKPKVETALMKKIDYHNDYIGNGDKSSLVKLAYSLVGSPYVAGGTTPAGFDCSGFVQYLYAQIGISVSRSSSTQQYDGVAVSYDAAQPGDILNWGYVDGSPTHSAIYVGNGKMIHATNPRQGVLLSDVAAWTRGSGTRVIGVRRI